MKHIISYYHGHNVGRLSGTRMRSTCYAALQTDGVCCVSTFRLRSEPHRSSSAILANKRTIDVRKVLLKSTKAPFLRLALVSRPGLPPSLTFIRLKVGVKSSRSASSASSACDTGRFTSAREEAEPDLWTLIGQSDLRKVTPELLLPR